MAVVAGVLIAARAPIGVRQFWAEDGTVFFQAAHNDGPWAPFGEAYNGYYHFLPRLIGAVSSVVPLDRAATTTWLLTTAVVAWCAATVFLAARPWLRSTWARAVFAVSLVMLPSLAAESIGSSANLQFTLLFTALVILVGTMTTPWQRASACALLLITGLTAPLAASLVPIAVWRVVRAKRLDVEVVSWAAGIAGQLAFIVLLGTGERPSMGSPSTTTVVGGYVDALLDNLGGPIGTAVAMVVLAGGAVIAYQTRDRSRLLFLVALPLAGLAIYVAMASRSMAAGLPPRYDLVPAWCVVWSALVAAELISTRGGRLRAVSPAIWLMLAIAWAVSFVPPSFRTDGTSWPAALDASSASCTEVARIEVMPVLDPPFWLVLIPCDDLGR